MNKLVKYIIAFTMTVLAATTLYTYDTKAEVFYLNGGIRFDTIYYADTNPDVKRECGYDSKKLIRHYENYGIFEGRLPDKKYETNMDAIRLGSPVPWDFLYKRAELRGKCDQVEFEYAWNAANQIVTPILGQTRLSQLKSITASIQATVNDHVPYTNDTYHYNDVCGVFGCDIEEHGYGASCAGVTKATGLCLAMLGIPFQHVYENNMKHQWCRVLINGDWYICDPYLNYVGIEPCPWKHPYLP